MTSKDGGPAFPGNWKVPNDKGGMDELSAPGMPLRDYAYVRFMSAMLSNPGLVDIPESQWFSDEQLGAIRSLVKHEVDVMLAEREKE